MSSPLKAPFPWFGGKSRAASLVWSAFGDVPNYVEPFAGSLAVLLGRPTAPRIETVNDLDCYLANFWRAMQQAPDEVARHADWPVNEADLHARHLWLVNQAEFREHMKSEPDFFDPKIAGWWVWGLSAWLGSGWCNLASAATEGPESTGPSRQIPFLGNAGRGVHRGGQISRQIPVLSRAGQGIHGATLGGSFDAYFHQLGDRLRRVRVCCGDWSRVVSDSATIHVGVTGVFLDPPYLEGNMNYTAGGVGTSLSADVRAWAVEHGEDKRLRIALCGYEGEHAMPAGWQLVEWKAKGGYGNSRKSGPANDNARRERIWFSPHCEVVKRQQGLFESLEVA